ncbi:MAG: CsgG/HfaB family protein [Rhodothermia bacterium]|nr:CsgG/HfaB family protein [Rhodothermia bacterium]
MRMRTDLRLAVVGSLIPLMLLLVVSAKAQDDGRSDLSTAIDAYFAADFDAATKLLAELSSDASNPMDVRREALQYLGRCYIAQRLEDEARSAIMELLQLEPPLVELDPDVEPPSLMKLYYDVRRDIRGSYDLEKTDPGLQTLAIIDFTNNSIDDAVKLAPLKWGLSSLLINQLNGATQLKVVERERLNWLLEELDLQKDAARVDQATAVRAGKLLGVTAVLLGSYMKLGNDMILNSRLVKVETGEILATDQVQGSANKVLQLAQELSLKVAKSINVEVKQDELGTRNDTSSLDAMISYSEGLALLEEDDYSAAYLKFMEALEYDDGYERARVKAENLRPLLAGG